MRADRWSSLLGVFRTYAAAEKYRGNPGIVCGSWNISESMGLQGVHGTLRPPSNICSNSPVRRCRCHSAYATNGEIPPTLLFATWGGLGLSSDPLLAPTMRPHSDFRYRQVQLGRQPQNAWCRLKVETGHCMELMPPAAMGL